MATRDPRGDGTGAVTTGGGTEPRAREGRLCAAAVAAPQGGKR